MAHNFLSDSDFFIALYSEHDTNHARSLNALEYISRFKEAVLSLSLFVYGETATVLAQRVSKKTASHFMDDLEEGRAIVITDIGAAFREAQEIFRKQKSKNVSFVDATNIALMRSGQFNGLLSFDSDYIKNGISLYKKRHDIWTK